MPLHDPTESLRKAWTTIPSLKTTQSAEAHSASFFVSAMAGLPSLLKVSVGLNDDFEGGETVIYKKA